MKLDPEPPFWSTIHVFWAGRVERVKKARRRGKRRMGGFIFRPLRKGWMERSQEVLGKRLLQWRDGPG